ncbi:MAG: YbbR-like domain-containing protein [Candidatus Hydrogenedentota bacterium]|nr:MAG: YbbR-like domain-containing protein [Candidatus Hydrogenedentota bacterium]
MKRWLIRSLKKDLAAKLISLVMAIALWAYVQNLQISELTLNVPVKYRNMPSDLSFSKAPPRFVKIKIRGKKDDLKFPSSHLKAQVDLTQAEEGKQKYKVQFSTDQLPQNVKLVSQDLKIPLSLEKTIEKQIRVRAVLEGNVPEGYRIGRRKVVPEKITLIGPASILDNVRYVETYPVSLRGHKESFFKKVKVRLPSKKIKAEPNRVTVSVLVFQENTVNERTITKIPIVTRNLDPALTAALSNKTVEVLLQGDSDILKKVKPKDIHVWVDLEGTHYNPQTGHILPFDTEPGIPVSAKLLRYAGKVNIISIIPEQVTVRFRVKPEFIKKEEQKKRENPIEEIENPPKEEQ